MAIVSRVGGVHTYIWQYCSATAEDVRHLSELMMRWSRRSWEDQVRVTRQGLASRRQRQGLGTPMPCHLKDISRLGQEREEVALLTNVGSCRRIQTRRRVKRHRLVAAGFLDGFHERRVPSDVWATGMCRPEHGCRGGWAWAWVWVASMGAHASRKRGS